MSTFHLQIVTPDGLLFDGQAEKIIVRTIEGDVCILSGHLEYMSPVATGEAKITLEDGKVRLAACSGGLISVRKDITRLVADTFEWAENIDVHRAKKAKEAAEAQLKDNADFEYKLAELKLKRALVRIRVGESLK